MEYNKVIFYCFSGTGNTLSAVRKMAETFEDKGKKAEIRKIPDDKWESEDNSLYIFAFPVYEQSMPLFVYDWIADIPVQQSKNYAAALSTLADSSGFVKSPLRKLLEEKNFEPVAIEEIIFPTNFIYSVSDEKCKKIMKKGLLNSEKYAEDILSGDVSWPPVSKIKSLLFPFLRLASKIFSWFFSHYKADESCIKCHLCENLCPVDNIKVTENKVTWGRKCQVCLRCINFCPQKSIKSTVCNFPYKAHYIADGIKAVDFHRNNKVIGE